MRSFISIVTLMINIKKAIIKFKKGRIYYSNIVCTARIPLKSHAEQPWIKPRIDLNKIAKKSLNVIYDMGSGPAISFRFANPTMTCSLYNTGSIIHCGGNNMIQKKGTVRRLIQYFQTMVPEMVKDVIVPIRVVNTMSTIKVPYSVDVMTMAEDNPNESSYFKENFTGCTLKLFNDNRKITATVFTTGSINLAGCISCYEYHKYVNELNKFLFKYRDVIADSDSDSESDR